MSVTATASCLPGKILLGGFGRVIEETGAAGKVALYAVYPSNAAGVAASNNGTATAYTAKAVATADSDGLGTNNRFEVVAYAICSS